MRVTLWTMSLVALVFGFAATPLSAEVVRIDGARRAPIWLAANPSAQPDPYEKLTGQIYFAVDPRLAANHIITDIDKAPRNAAGKVEFSVRLLPAQAEDDRDAGMARSSTKCRTAAAKGCSASSITRPAAPTRLRRRRWATDS